MSHFYLGIDVAKDTLDVALLEGVQTQRGHFSNDPEGFDRLNSWAAKRGCRQMHACLEATGRYWESLALSLHGQGHKVSVVNPKLIRKHAEATMQRNKTDAQDALTIADYCRKQQPELWTPPLPGHRKLQEMVRHVHALKADRTRALNRRQSGIQSSEVLSAIEAQIAFLDKQIAKQETHIQQHIDQDPKLRQNRDLLTSIPGIGAITAAAFLAEVPDVNAFPQASQLAAFAGLTPGQRKSGSSLKGPGKLVKWGNAYLRAALFMPALSAHRWNPVIAALRHRLLKRGKKKMTVVIAVMRKLLQLCYGVLKTQKPFDSCHAMTTNT